MSNLQHNLVVFGRLLRRVGIDVHGGRMIKLVTSGTAGNWNTVLKLSALAGAA